jgi:hypothetical protein
VFAARPTWRTVVCFGDQRTDGNSAINFILYVQHESESAFKSSVPGVFEALGSLKKGASSTGCQHSQPLIFYRLDYQPSGFSPLHSWLFIQSQFASRNAQSCECKKSCSGEELLARSGIHHFCTVALGPSERAPTWGHPHFSYGEAFPAKSSTQPHLQLYPKCKIYKIFFGRSKRCQVRAKQSAKLIPRKYRIWQHGSSSWVRLDAGPRRCSNASLRIIFCQANTGTAVFSSAERDMRLALRMKVFTAKMRWWG